MNNLQDEKWRLRGSRTWSDRYTERILGRREREKGENNLDNLSTYTSIHGRRVWYSAVHSYKREGKLSSRSKREIDLTHNGTTTNGVIHA